MALDALEHGLPIIEDFGGKEQLQLQHKAIAVLYEALRAALAAPPQELDLPKVQLWEFLKLIEGKEDFRGIPLMRTEWPMPEKNS